MHERKFTFAVEEVFENFAMEQKEGGQLLPPSFFSPVGVGRSPRMASELLSSRLGFGLPVGRGFGTQGFKSPSGAVEVTDFSSGFVLRVGLSLVGLDRWVGTGSSV
jgi:hypothetical protein